MAMIDVYADSRRRGPEPARKLTLWQRYQNWRARRRIIRRMNALAAFLKARGGR